jgi:hypothetical protein
MAKRRCIDCHLLVDAPKSRCPEHERAKDRARGTRQERGYDSEHDRIRARYQRRMDQGEMFTCWRCPRLIDPRSWDLGHDDIDRTIYRGPECVACNRATSGRH